MIKVSKHKFYEVNWAGDKKIVQELEIIYVIIDLILWKVQFEYTVDRGRKGRFKSLSRNG